MFSWIDLTHTISETTLCYPGDPSLVIKNRADYPQQVFHMDEITTAMHVGTHLDSPYHFIENGKKLHELDINLFIQNANVIHVIPKDGVIYSSDIQSELDKLANHQSILLIDSKHSTYFDTPAYFHDCPRFEDTLTELLIKYQIKVLGLDLPTIMYSTDSPLKAHLETLGNNIIIIEGLHNLDQCSSLVEFIGLPLKIKGLDGSFIRAVAKNID